MRLGSSAPSWRATESPRTLPSGSPWSRAWASGPTAATRSTGNPLSEDHRQRQAAAYAVRGTGAAILTFIGRQYTIDGLRLVTGTYEDIRVPVLQIHGSEDASITVAAAKKLSPRLPDSRFVLLEGVNHDVHVHAPDRIAAEIQVFADALGP